MKKIVCPRRRNALNPAKPVQKLIALAAALALPLLLAQPAKAAVFGYTVSLSDAGEANPSPGATGSGTVSYNDVSHILALNVTFSGLQGPTTASHIHAPTTVAFTGNAGVATTLPSFDGFPLGVTSGTWTTNLDLTLSSSYNPSFISNNGGTTATAEVALFNAIQAGKAYWNIHSSFGPGGEIRGFLVAVPEPSTIALLGGAGAAFLAWRRTRKTS